jgi:hypothetical protein
MVVQRTFIKGHSFVYRLYFTNEQNYLFVDFYIPIRKICFLTVGANHFFKPNPIVQSDIINKSSLFYFIFLRTFFIEFRKHICANCINVQLSIGFCIFFWHVFCGPPVLTYIQYVVHRICTYYQSYTFQVHTFKTDLVFWQLLANCSCSKM